MNTNIFKCDSNGTITQLAVYSLEPEKALIAWIYQNLRNDFNTWDYPKHMKGVKPCKRGTGYYYEDRKTDTVYAAYPAQES